MMKIPYFSYEKVKLALYTLNKCKIMFAVIYFDIGTFFYMFEQQPKKKKKKQQ